MTTSTTATGTTRVPRTEITGLYGTLLKTAMRKVLGGVPEGAEVMWHHPAIFKDTMRFGRRVEKWDQLDRDLGSFASMAAAAEIGCGACLDLHYFLAHNHGLDEVKAREVPRWRESTVFTPLERSVMQYAAAMCRTPLDRLRTVARRREEYVGPWLPEPLLTTPDVAEDVELADSLSMAMLLVLETLPPTERAVFVLREVFALGYDELADAVGKTPAAVRQIARRARAHVAERRPRGVTSRADTRAALDAFQRTLETGDLQGFVDVLAPDVVALGDGGGVVQALPRPVVGVDKVTRLFAAGLATVGRAMTAEVVQVNGWPALLLRLEGTIDSVMSLRVEDGLVSGIYTVRNPEKLSRIAREVALTR